MNRNQGVKLRIPCAGKTKGSGINAGEWMKRCISDLSTCGQTSGFLHTKREGCRSYLADHQEDFFWPLEELQSRGNMSIPSLCDIREECGIWHSLHRGATTHAINMGVDESPIHLINRWRKETQGPTKKGPIMDVCMELETLTPTTIKHSLSLQTQWLSRAGGRHCRDNRGGILGATPQGSPLGSGTCHHHPWLGLGVEPGPTSPQQ
jgi:hypothetical protein